MLQGIVINPLTVYLKFAWEHLRNRFKYKHFRQGYMARVIKSRIEPHVRVHDHSHIHCSSIGSYSYVAAGTHINLTQIGRFCSIGPGCRIGLGAHPSRNFVSTSPAFFSTEAQCGTTFVDSPRFTEASPIVIGNDVWVGANAIIADGVSIGDGAIIGAGAVVVSNVSSYAIFGGVPARLIRFRFSPEQIAWLLNFAWWNRDEQWLRSHAHLFNDIAKLMNEAASAPEICK